WIENSIGDEWQRRVTLPAARNPRVGQTVAARPGYGRPSVKRHKVVVVVGIHLPAQLQLLHVADALRPLGLALGPRQGRQQHRRENSDDGDDYQQFDQGKSRPPAWALLREPLAAGG